VEWPWWTEGSDGEGREEDVSTGWKLDEDEVCTACEEAWSATEDSEKDEEKSRPPVTVKVLFKDGARVAVLDLACYSIWVDKKAFWEMGGHEYDEGGSAWSADGSPLQVAGRGRLDFFVGAGVPEAQGTGDAKVAIKIANRSTIHGQVPNGPTAG
jgi:hypothetical protein